MGSSILAYLDQAFSQEEQKLLANAKRILKDLKAGKTFGNWLVIGEALITIRREALRVTKSNSVNSGRYRRTFESYCRSKGLDFDKSVRSNLLWLLEPDNRPVMERVRAQMTETERLKIANPSVMARYVRAAMKASAEDAEDPMAPPRAKARRRAKGGKGVLSREDFQTIRNCLHPDRLYGLMPGVQLDDEMLARYGRAFDLFNKLEDELVGP